MRFVSFRNKCTVYGDRTECLLYSIYEIVSARACMTTAEQMKIQPSTIDLREYGEYQTVAMTLQPFLGYGRYYRADTTKLLTI